MAEQKKNVFREMFRIGKKIGKGQFGDVLIAQDKESKYLVALKVLDKARIERHGLMQQLTLESKIQMGLQHPNILKLFGMFKDEKYFYLVLDFARGGDLFQHLREVRRFNEKKAATMLGQLADALAYCHSENIIHRDIKPENIMLCKAKARPMLSDFGWSVVHQPDAKTGETRTRSTLCGTPDYLSPEMVCGERHDHRVDNWALGVLCYEMLYGRAPFTDTTGAGASASASKDKEPYSNIAAVNLRFPPHPDVSVGAQRLIQSLLKKDPEERAEMFDILHTDWIRTNCDVTLPIKGVARSSSVVRATATNATNLVAGRNATASNLASSTTETDVASSSSAASNTFAAAITTAPADTNVVVPVTTSGATSGPRATYTTSAAHVPPTYTGTGVTATHAPSTSTQPLASSCQPSATASQPAVSTSQAITGIQAPQTHSTTGIQSLAIARKLPVTAVGHSKTTRAKPLAFASRHQPMAFASQSAGTATGSETKMVVSPTASSSSNSSSRKVISSGVCKENQDAAAAAVYKSKHYRAVADGTLAANIGNVRGDRGVGKPVSGSTGAVKCRELIGGGGKPGPAVARSIYTAGTAGSSGRVFGVLKAAAAAGMAAPQQGERGGRPQHARGLSGGVSRSRLVSGSGGGQQQGGAGRRVAPVTPYRGGTEGPVAGHTAGKVPVPPTTPYGGGGGGTQRHRRNGSYSAATTSSQLKVQSKYQSPMKVPGQDTSSQHPPPPTAPGASHRNRSMVTAGAAGATTGHIYQHHPPPVTASQRNRSMVTAAGDGAGATTGHIYQHPTPPATASHRDRFMVTAAGDGARAAAAAAPGHIYRQHPPPPATASHRHRSMVTEAGVGATAAHPQAAAASGAWGATASHRHRSMVTAAGDGAGAGASAATGHIYKQPPQGPRSVALVSRTNIYTARPATAADRGGNAAGSSQKRRNATAGTADGKENQGSASASTAAAPGDK